MEQLPETRIHENAIKAWKISTFLYGFLIYLIPGFFYFLFTSGAPISWLIPAIAAPVALSLHLVLIFVFPKVRWKRWRYDVGEKGIDMHRGIIIRKRTMVPINRVQHVDTKQGPIYRKYGLSCISMSTAATTHEIPALDDQTAAQLRGLIAELVRKVKDDV